MMKKHDEGYVLAYVTVVLALFCLIATMILTGAMKNLNAQQDDIARMKDQYEAAGMIEKVVAQLPGLQFEVDQEVGDTGVLCLDSENNIVTLVATHGAVTITCKLNLENGQYVAYQIGTAEPTEDGGAEP